jgi:hypothetical protein
MNIEFDEEKHLYKIDGKTVPSVTQVQETIWGPYTGNPMYGKFGTAVHSICENILGMENPGAVRSLLNTVNDNDFVIDGKAKNLLKSAKNFVDFIEQNEIGPFRTEGEDVICEKVIGYRDESVSYAGKFDFISPVSPTVVDLYDIKSGSRHNVKHQMQMIAYADAIKQTMLLDTDHYVIIYIGGEKFEVHYHQFNKEIRDDFHAALRIFKRYKRIKGVTDNE